MKLQWRMNTTDFLLYRNATNKELLIGHILICNVPCWYIILEDGLMIYLITVIIISCTPTYYLVGNVTK